VSSAASLVSPSACGSRTSVDSLTDLYGLPRPQRRGRVRVSCRTPARTCERGPFRRTKRDRVLLEWPLEVIVHLIARADHGRCRSRRSRTLRIERNTDRCPWWSRRADTSTHLGPGTLLTSVCPSETTRHGGQR